MLDATGSIDAHTIHKFIIEYLHNIDHNGSKALFVDIQEREITIGYDTPATIEQINKMVNYFSPSESHREDDEMSTRGMGRIFMPYAYPGHWHVVTQAEDSRLACASMDTKTILEQLDNPAASEADIVTVLSDCTEYARKHQSYEEVEAKKPKYLVDFFREEASPFPFAPKLLLHARHIVKKSALDAPFSFLKDSFYTPQYWEDVRRYIAINARHLTNAAEDPIRFFVRFPHQETFTDMATTTGDPIGWHSLADEIHNVVTIYKASQTLADKAVLAGGRGSSKGRKKQQTTTVLPGTFVFYVHANGDDEEGAYVIENGKTAMVLDVKPEDMERLTEIAKNTVYFNTTPCAAVLPTTDKEESAYAGVYLMLGGHLTGSTAMEPNFATLYRKIHESYTRVQLRSMLELKTRVAQKAFANINKLKYDSTLTTEGERVVKFLTNLFLRRLKAEEEGDSSDAAESLGTVYSRIVCMCDDGDLVIKNGYTNQKCSWRRSNAHAEDAAHPWAAQQGVAISGMPYEIGNLRHSKLLEQELFTLLEDRAKDPASGVTVKYGETLIVREYVKLSNAAYLELIADMNRLALDPRFVPTDDS